MPNNDVVAGLAADLPPFAEARWIDVGADSQTGFWAGARTGSPSAWRLTSVAGTVLLLPVTPPAWSFWLGLVGVVDGHARPIVLFKNAVPMFETTVPGVHDRLRLQHADWPAHARAVLDRNPGLAGLLGVVAARLPGDAGAI